MTPIFEDYINEVLASDRHLYFRTIALRELVKELEHKVLFHVANEAPMTSPSTFAQHNGAALCNAARIPEQFSHELAARRAVLQALEANAEVQNAFAIIQPKVDAYHKACAEEQAKNEEVARLSNELREKLNAQKHKAEADFENSKEVRALKTRLAELESKGRSRGLIGAIREAVLPREKV
jgi:hypothetical protein